MKFAADRPWLRSPEGHRKLLEIANAVRGRAGHGRIYIDKINGPFLFGDKGTPAEYRAGLDLAIAWGWLGIHESGTYVVHPVRC